MRTRKSIVGLCLAAMFTVIFGSILGMALFTKQGQPTAISVEAVAGTQGG